MLAYFRMFAEFQTEQENMHSIINVYVWMGDEWTAVWMEAWVDGYINNQWQRLRDIGNVIDRGVRECIFGLRFEIISTTPILMSSQSADLNCLREWKSKEVGTTVNFTWCVVVSLQTNMSQYGYIFLPTH